LSGGTGRVLGRPVPRHLRRCRPCVRGLSLPFTVSCKYGIDEARASCSPPRRECESVLCRTQTRSSGRPGLYHVPPLPGLRFG
jgi:hypothetical protein